MSLIVCFCLESLLMLITLSSVWEKKIRVKKYFSAQTQTLWQNANIRSSCHHLHHKSTPLSPTAHTLKEMKHLSFLSLSLQQNLASLSNFSFFFVFFFPLVRSGIPSPQANSIYCFFFPLFVQGAQNLLSLVCEAWGMAALGLRARSKPLQDEIRSPTDECSLDPCAELLGRLIEAHHTWEHQRLASIEIISWPRELLAFEL